MRAAGGRTVLMDFGAGYDVKTDEAAGRRLAGTPLYLAPEIFDGEPRTASGDIYSVGVLLFHLVTEKFPVEGQTGADVRRQHQAARAAPDAARPAPGPARRVHPGGRAGDRDRAEGSLPHRRRARIGVERGAGDRARHEPDAGPLPFPFKLAIAAGLAALVALGAGYSRWMPATRERPSFAPASAATAGTATIAGPDRRRRELPHRSGVLSRTRAGAPCGSRPAPGWREGDRLSLQVISSVPTYVYVVNEDDRGESYLLFPLPGLRAMNPLTAGTRHEIPGTVNGERHLLDRLERRRARALPDLRQPRAALARVPGRVRQAAAAERECARGGPAALPRSAGGAARRRRPGQGAGAGRARD